VNRRSFLRVSLGAAGAFVLAELTGCQQDFNARREALRQCANRPGPAEAKLAALHPSARRLPLPLPFEEAEVPGFSPATHRVHWYHHYLEYLYRWEHGERELVRGAIGLAALEEAKADRAAFETARQRAIRHHTALRRAANMVTLHELYWRDFWNGGTKRDRLKAAAQTDALLSQTDETAPHYSEPLWILALRRGSNANDPDSAPLRPRLHVWCDEDESIPWGMEAAAAIDCPDHAWLLDFLDFSQYLSQLFLNITQTEWDALEIALREEEKEETPVKPHESRHAPLDGDSLATGAFSPLAGSLAEDIGVEVAGDKPKRLLRGLQLVAGPEGQVALAERLDSCRPAGRLHDPGSALASPNGSTPSLSLPPALTLAVPGFPAGLWSHRLVCLIPGDAPSFG